MVLGIIGTAGAASIFDITFPIPELGNCADKTACKAYCDELSHADACAAFGKQHGIGDARSTQQASALPNIGPGGCKSTTECKVYCDDSDHLDECIQFAESNGLLNKKEVQQARKAITKGPGGCANIKECKQYCSSEDNQLECVEYAHRQGQISDSDFKAIKDVKEQGGPGGCRGNEECHSYCQDESHIDECLSFSQDHGFISKDDAVTIRKAGFGGAGPGGCKGKDACRAYCEAPDHQSECLDFAEQKGFMSKEEAARARKFVGKTGPGGCRGDQCRTYCENPANAEACLEHAEREGFLPKEEIERGRKFLKVTQESGGPGGCRGQNECRTYCQDEDHEQECFDFGKKQGLLRPEEEKQFKAGMDIRKKVEQSGGPGGCKGDDECQAYCTDPSHTEECIAFAATHGGIDEDQARMMLQEFTTGKFSGPGGGSFEDFQRGHEDSAMRFDEFKQLEQQFRGGPGGGFGGGPRGMPFPPGKFPRQGGVGQGFGAGDQGFVGPGGCTGPAECIKYCSEHRKECFSGGPQGEDGFDEEGFEEGEDHEGDFSQFHRPQFGRPQFGGEFEEGEEGPQGSFRPQLRGNIVHEFKQEDLPEGFGGRSTEEKQQFFREKFEQFKGQKGAFPGMPSQGFPGRGDTRGPRSDFDDGEGDEEGDFGEQEFQGQQQRFNPQRKFPGSDTKGQPFDEQGNEHEFFEGEEGDFPRDFQGGMMQKDGQFLQPPGGQNFPSGTQRTPGQTGERFPFPSDGNATQGGQFPPPPGGFQQHPSGGTFQEHPFEGGTFQQQPPSPPPSGQFQPPPGGSFQQQSGGTFQPPPDGTFQQQPPPPPPPSGQAPAYNFFASVLNLILGNY